MKNHIVKAVFLNAALLISLQTSAGNGTTKPQRPDANHCLEISGRIMNHQHKDDQTYWVYLHRGQEVDSVEVRGNRTFRFMLNKNDNYTIRIVKEGYAERLVCVSTVLPKGVETKPIFRFHFDTQLMEEETAKNMNADALDFPIALVCFHPDKGWFDYRKKYTEHIKKQVLSAN